MIRKQNLKDILEFAPDAIVIINTNGEIMYANVLAEKLFQYSKTQLYNQKIEFLIPSRYQGQHVKHRNAFMDKSTVRPMGHPGLDLFGKRKDGSEFRVEISLSPVYVEYNEKLIISAIRDISGRIVMEEKLKNTQGMFERIYESSFNGIVKFEEVFDERNNIIDYKYVLVNRRFEELLLPREMK